ncbi:glycoside hydrolase family 15 protein [Nocardioides koreensis]|uniref:Glycoside hydrolase family 15 protein n=1 Tax=Nocardioides koreensis TaxID=433651 RepID=A0ABN2Z6V8_9ACTN
MTGDRPGTPVPLRQYALLADGERGALVGPHGDVAFLCAPRWHDDAVFAGLLGGRGGYAVTPRDRRFVWGGHYDQDTLIWRSRWVATAAVTECREALAFPGERDRVVLLRRVEATLGDAHVRARLECRAEFGARSMTVRRGADGVWEGRTGDLRYRWSGVPSHARLDEARLTVDLDVPEGGSHDLVLEISREPLPDAPPDPAAAWARTERAWRYAVPDLGASVAPGESHHSYAVLRGLTGASGAMVAAATTALPERADQGRNYDYRYAWIRDQCFAGQAAAAVGGHELLDAAVRFVSARVLEDGPRLRPAYTVDGDPVPDERRLPLPGYPGAPVRVGNRANSQFQLDALGEALLLLAAADRAGRLDGTGEKAVEALAEAIEQRRHDPDAGIWELDDRRWAHSRLICAAGLRAAADRRTGATAAGWQQLADSLVASVDRDCRHPDGRWQRSPGDPGVDTALLLPGLRGAVPADDPRHLLTCRAVVDDLTDDGYVYRFRQDPDRPLHAAEGAFVLSGFHMSMAALQQGDVAGALRWFERNRSALGPPGLFAEEYDVVQRQLRGNLPQAFVHALLLETAQRLGEAGVSHRGFEARDR